VLPITLKASIRSRPTILRTHKSTFRQNSIPRTEEILVKPATTERRLSISLARAATAAPRGPPRPAPPVAKKVLDLHSGWKENKNENGEVFYLHVATATSTWEDPSTTQKELLECYDDNGVVFYCETKTGECKFKL
jgi:hypothetical protein